MHTLAFDPCPVTDLPFEAQAELMWRDLERLNGQVPVGAVMQSRVEAQAAHGDAYRSPFDLSMMWEKVGDPHLTLGPRYTQPRPGHGEVQYGFRLFSGLSEDGEILQVTGDMGSSLGTEPAGYDVVTLQLPDPEIQTWTVRKAEARPYNTSYDVRLTVGERALTLVKDEPEDEALISFRTTSRSSGTMTRDGERKTYSRPLLQDLYVAVKAFDAKYGHLAVVGVWPPVTDLPAAAMISR